MDEANEDAQTDAEHFSASAAEVRRRFASLMKDLLASCVKSKDLGEKNDVFAIQFHAGSIKLQAVIVPS